jgi:hypothetical protein
MTRVSAVRRYPLTFEGAQRKAGSLSNSSRRVTDRPHRTFSAYLRAMLLCAAVLAAFPGDADTDPASETMATTALDAAVNERRRYYNERFPQILFLTLKGGNLWLEDLTAVSILLGQEPASLDYEHPPELREDLMTVSLQRLELMLRYQAPSASLFLADQPMGWPENVCVITIDPCAIAGDDDQATRHLLDLPEEELARLSPDVKLQCMDYLRFVFDHEAFHCLSSLYKGPQPSSFEPLWAEYWHHREENGADVFATAMHLKHHQGMTGFARNLLRVRCMALYNGDADHWTSRAIAEPLQEDPIRFSTLSVEEIFKHASGIRDRPMPDYDAYLTYRASALAAMEQIGIPDNAITELRKGLEDLEPDPDLTAQILLHSKACRSRLFDDSEAAEPCPPLIFRSD